MVVSLIDFVIHENIELVQHDSSFPSLFSPAHNELLDHKFGVLILQCKFLFHSNNHFSQS